MNASLSVILPVYNAQATVGPLTAELLDVLPELTSNFDLLLIDDGSTDATAEMMADLARDYPQVTLLHHPAHAGSAIAWRTGLSRVGGERVLLCDAECPVHAFDVPKLWQIAATREIVAARVASRSTSGWTPRLAGRASGKSAANRPAMLLLPRTLAAGWLERPSAEDLTSYLARRGHVMYEVDVRDRAGFTAPQRFDGPRAGIPGAPPKPTAGATKRDLKGPNYLARLRAFALGE